MTLHVKHFEKPCAGRCGRTRDLGYSVYCRVCRNEYARLHRLSHRALSPEARQRANCRSYTKTLIARGQLVPQPCEDCGAEKVQAHHDDYTKPRLVRWKCKDCHRKHHHPERVPTCSRCGGPNNRAGQVYCRLCHATNMREHRAREKARIAAMKARLQALDAKEVHM